MCPEKQLLSMYIDKEIGEPGKRVLERHIEQCGACAEVLASYTYLHKKLVEDVPPEPQFLETRLFEALKEKASHNHVSLWRRKIGVPVPALAFSMVLILVLAFGITLVSVRGSFHGPGNNGIFAARNQAIPVKLTISDIEELKKLLQTDNYILEVDMQLPKDHNFSIIGEPVFIWENAGRAYDLRP